MDTRPIGLTGAIAGGKSTVLAMLGDLGLCTASSDLVAREVFREVATQAALRERLGGTGPVEPGELREAMLRDPSLRRWTNRLMHPLVGERMATIEADVVEVPLLFEACLQGRYREVWTASCGTPTRARRLRERYGAEVDVDSLSRWQLDEKTKESLGDTIIRTDRALATVLTQVVAEAARCFPARIAHPA